MPKFYKRRRKNPSHAALQSLRGAETIATRVVARDFLDVPTGAWLALGGIAVGGLIAAAIVASESTASAAPASPVIPASNAAAIPSSTTSATTTPVTTPTSPGVSPGAPASPPPASTPASGAAAPTTPSVPAPVTPGAPVSPGAPAPPGAPSPTAPGGPPSPTSPASPLPPSNSTPPATPPPPGTPGAPAANPSLPISNPAPPGAPVNPAQPTSPVQPTTSPVQPTDLISDPGALSVFATAAASIVPNGSTLSQSDLVSALQAQFASNPSAAPTWPVPSLAPPGVTTAGQVVGAGNTSAPNWILWAQTVSEGATGTTAFGTGAAAIAASPVGAVVTDPNLVAYAQGLVTALASTPVSVAGTMTSDIFSSTNAFQQNLTSLQQSLFAPTSNASAAQANQVLVNGQLNYLTLALLIYLAYVS